jgi:nucleoside-diphosphate-sugar epimerase
MSVKKRILITGADGFIGKHIAEALHSDFELHTYSRRKSAYSFHHQGDICDIDQLQVSFEIVIHAAGNKTDAATMHRVNVEGTSAVVRYVKQHNAKLIYIGSGGIYGIYRNRDHIITPSSQYCPDNAYEQSKADAQRIVEQAALPDNSYIILQPTNVIGEGDQTKKLLHLFKTLQNGSFFFINKNARVNYVYVKKLSQVVSTIVEKESYSNQSYIVNDPMRISAFIAICAEALGVSAPSKKIPRIFQPLLFLIAKITPILPRPLRRFSLGRYYEMTSERYYSTQETDNQFTLEENTDIHHGIHNLVAYYRDNKWL